MKCRLRQERRFELGARPLQMLPNAVLGCDMEAVGKNPSRCGQTRFGLGERGRSVAVPGHSRIQTATRLRQSDAGRFYHVAAPEEGRTPGGFWRDGENGNRDGRAPQ